MTIDRTASTFASVYATVKRRRGLTSSTATITARCRSDPDRVAAIANLDTNLFFRLKRRRWTIVPDVLGS